MKNMQTIHKLSSALEMMKGFETGYTTKNKSEMLVKIGDDLFKLKLVELPEKELELESIDKYL